MNISSLSPEGQMLFNRFRSRLPHRQELDAVIKCLPRKKSDGMVMLDIGMPNPVMSAFLRESGGVWATVARSPEFAEEASRFLESEVVCLDANGTIPFEQHSFDVVVVSLGMLAAMQDSEFFIRECNRVLKSAGQLIISTQYRKSFSFINVLRNRAQKSVGGMIGGGYTERGLFRFLKTGFDVISVDSYSGFFVEMIRVHEYQMLMAGMEEEEVSARVRLKYWFAEQLDFFTLWARGYVIIVHARRRQWRERATPVLADGRTIHEAVLKHT